MIVGEKYPICLHKIISLIYKAVIKPIKSHGLVLWGCVRKSNSNNAEYPIQNSLNPNKRTPVRYILYSKYKIEHPLSKGRHPQTNQ